MIYLDAGKSTRYFQLDHLMAKRKDFSLSEKIELLKKYDSSPKCSQRRLASNLGIPQSTLCRLLKHRSEITAQHECNENSTRKRKRVGKAEDVEAALLEWYKSPQMKNATITRAILAMKAEEFADKLGTDNFTATDGWLTRWKMRNNVVYKTKSSEKNNLNTSIVDIWLAESLPDLVKGYSPDDIYIMSETALYYRALPDHILSLKSDSYSCDKKIKAYITVLLTCNGTGTVKKPLLVIGNSKYPPCLRGVEHLPVQFYHNKNAWMTSEIFKNLLIKWDSELKNEKIVLVLKNCPAHPQINLENIKLCYLPEKMASHIEPLDKGIVTAFKGHYRTDVKARVATATADPTKPSSSHSIAKSITLLDALHMCMKAWDCVTPTSISNCFKKAGIFKQSVDISHVGTESILCQKTQDDEELKEEFLNWVNVDENVPTSADQIEDDIILTIQGSKIEILVASEDEDDELLTDTSPPTVHESHLALQTIRRTLEHRGASSDDYKHFYKIEKIIMNLIS